MIAGMIRALDPVADRAAVAAFCTEAADYWLLIDGAPPGDAAVETFFTAAPPGCDPARSLRLGLFVDSRLSGLAELSFGFPEPDDAYLGLMVLAPSARGAGIGQQFLDHLITRARKAGAPRLCLGVVEGNPRARAFWEREGFTATGVTRKVTTAHLEHVVHRLSRAL